MQNPRPECLSTLGESLTRREILGLAGALALVPALPACGPRHDDPGDTNGLAKPVYYSSTRALAAAIQRRELSSDEVVRACLDRIDEVNGALNAVVQIAREEALARAGEADAATARGERWGPLHGVPMTIKDSLDTAGLISTGGTTGRASFVPERDATVVARLRAAGAILLGKSNTPELTLSFETDNRVYGRTNNPYELSRTPGGSSGGAAAIVAAGGAPFDIGSDYGGSIRLPAHCCGLAGIKPSAGRVPRTGHIYPFGGIQDTFQQIGPIARSVDDLHLLLPIIAGPDWVDPGTAPLEWREPPDVDLARLTVSFHTDNGVMRPTTETIATVEAAAGALAPAVSALEEQRPPDLDLQVALSLYFWDGGVSVRRLLRDAGTTEHTLQMFTEAPAMTAAQLDEALARWYDFRSRMHRFVERYDAIVCPVNAWPAVPHGQSAAEGAIAAYSYTFTYNLVGWPAAVVRAGSSPEGLPIGVQVVARPGHEDVALALAKVIETARGGFVRPAL